MAFATGKNFDDLVVPRLELTRVAGAGLRHRVKMEDRSKVDGNGGFSGEDPLKGPPIAGNLFL